MKIFNIPVILGVLTDWRVILTCVCFLLVLAFSGFIISYRKKPPKPKGKKPPKPASAPEQPAETEAQE